MQSFKKSVDHLVSENPSQLILGVLFILYILGDVQTPEVLAEPVDTLFGKVIVAAIAIIIFMKTNPVIGVLGFVVAYQVIKTASVTTGTYGMKHYLATEASKLKEMQSFNPEKIEEEENNTIAATTNINGSLEAEMVSKLAPLVMSGGDSGLTYSPILDGQHSAASLMEE